MSAVLHAVDRRRAGVARRRPDDRDPSGLLGQHVLEQTADELQGDVLERQRRTVEQLLHEVVVADLNQRDNGRMGERTVRVGAHRRESSTAMSSPTKGCMICAARAA